MTFNGERKPWLYLLEGRQKSPFAPTRNNLIKVAGMPGAYVGSKEIDVIYITQPVGFIVKDDEHALRLKDELAQWLLTDEAVPLQFDDELGRTYYAEIDGTIEDFQRFVDQRKGTITFLCADPFSYGPEINKEISSIHLEHYAGTTETWPILELTAKEPSTFVLVQNNDDTIKVGEDEQPRYMMLGKPYDVGDNVFRKYERVFYTNANSLVGWTSGTAADIDGGVVGGSIVSSNNRFIADGYGSGSQWHGPVIKHSLPEPLQDFKLSSYVGFMNEAESSMVGRLEIYLLDSLGQAVCKMALKDTSAARANVFAEMRAGNRETGDMIINDYGSRAGVWNNFSGRLEITREDNVWSAWVGVRNSDGVYVKRRIVRRWIDYNRKYMRRATQIVIHLGTVGTHMPPHARTGVSSIIIDKINQQPDAIPYIVEKDDIIRFDMKTGSAYINGVDAGQFGTLGDHPFKLVKGHNHLVAHPDIFDARLIYRNAYW